MKRKFLIFATILTSLLVACSDDDSNNDIPERKTVIEKVEVDVSAKSEAKVYFLSNDFPEYVKTPLLERFPKSVDSPDKADLIFVKSDDLASNKEKLIAAYNNGAAIVEVMPDMKKHVAWVDDLNLPYFQDSTPMLIMATSAVGSYNLEDKVQIVETEAASAPEEQASPSLGSKGDEEDNYDVESIPCGRTPEYCNIQLNSFVKWSNEFIEKRAKNAVGESTSSVVTPDEISELSKLIDDANYTYHIHYHGSLGYKSYEIAHIIFSDADKVYDRYAEMDIDVWITTLYGYKEDGVNGDAAKGDYYFVQTRVTSASKDMCQKYRKWHGAVVTHGFAFYMKEMEVTSIMVDPAKAGTDLDNINKMDFGKLEGNVPSSLIFAQTPSPITTSSGGSYTSGFSKTLNINGQAGLMGGKPTINFNIGGVFTWSNSQTRTLSDLSIENITVSNSKKVVHKYVLNNIAKEDELADCVPAIGRTTRYDEASWVWHVNGNERDDDDSSYYIMRIQARPTFGYAYRHATWGAEGNFETCCPGALNMTFKMPVPNRKRAGKVEFKTTTSNPITDIFVKDPKTGEVVASFTSAYLKGETVSRQVPVGFFDVEYSIFDGDTGSLIEKRVIRKAEIKTLKTTELSAATPYEKL